MISYKDRRRAIEEAKRNQQPAPAQDAAKTGVAASISQPASTVQPAVASKPPLAEPPAQGSAFDTASLGDMRNDELLKLARDLCSARGITTTSGFVNAPDFKPLVDCVMKRGIVREIFSPAPAKPVAPAAPDGAIAYGETMAAPSTADPNTTADISISLDLSEADRMVQRLDDIKYDDTITDAEKLDRVKAAFGEERARIVLLCGDESTARAVKTSAEKKNSEGRALDPVEGQMLQLVLFHEFMVQCEQIIAAKKIRSSPPPAQEDPAVDPAAVAPAPNPVPIPASIQKISAQTSRAAGAKGHGPLRRLISSPTLWGAAIVGSVAFAINVTDGFNDIAMLIHRAMESNRGISNVIRGFWEAKLHFAPLDSAKTVGYAFYGITGLGFVTSWFSKWLQARSIARDYAGVNAEQFKEMRSYAISEVSLTIKMHGDKPVINLFEKLITDEKLFDSLDTIRRNPAVFCSVMREAKATTLLLKSMDNILADAEANIVIDRLAYYLAQDKEHKSEALHELYGSDPLLKRKLDETFQKNEHGYYVNEHKKVALAPLFTKREGRRGDVLLSELELDYLRIQQPNS